MQADRHVVDRPCSNPRQQLVELKYHAGFVDVYIDFMLRRPAPEDASEIKHSQQRKQNQHNGKDHHCAAFPGHPCECAPLRFYLPSFYPPLVVVSNRHGLKSNRDASMQTAHERS